MKQARSDLRSEQLQAIHDSGGQALDNASLEVTDDVEV